MYYIYYNPSRGGLGDSIIGLQSVFVLCKVLKLDLKILDGSVKFYNYFEIPEEYKAKKNINLSTNYFDYQPSNNDLNKYLQFDTNLLKFKNKNIIISSGSNFCQYLYLNKNFNIEIKQEDVIKILFKKIIIPNKNILDLVHSVNKVYNLKDKVCVHIRCNNKWNDSNSNETEFKVLDTIKQFTKCIKNITLEPVLLITDNLELVKKVFQEEKIEYFVTPGEVCHSLKSNSIDFIKTLLDLLLIGETKISIISYWSNFSRIGVLRTLNTIYAVNPILNLEKNKFNYNIYFNEKFKKIESKDILFKESNKFT